MVKRLKKCMGTVFRKGHSAYNEGCTYEAEEPEPSIPIRYTRLTTTQHAMVDEKPIASYAEPEQTQVPEPTSVQWKRLRPKADPKSQLQSTSMEVGMQRLESQSYRTVHVGKNAEMWNYVIPEHIRTSPKCCGMVQWDLTAEQRRGMVWRERAICHRCGYVSRMFNLYEEIETSKRGRKPANINRGLAVGLTQTPISMTGFRKICLSSNIPPPSTYGMQKVANMVSDEIKSANEEDMKARRNHLKEINLLRGNAENVIDVECDGAYNNPLYSGVGNTPFQPATQCSYIVAENATTKKQIVAVETVNKLCSKHGMHTTGDRKCTIKSGVCSATVEMEQTIGDEQKWAKACFLNLKKDSLEVKHVTTDPDTSAYRAAEELHQRKVTHTQPQHLLDTQHVTRNQRKFIKGSNAVLNMMPGKTKIERERLQNKFSCDLSKRCQAEFSKLHTELNGDLDKISDRMPDCIDAIVMCYSGDHILCNRNSSVCKGEEEKNWLSESVFLKPNFTIDTQISKNRLTLRQCIDYRLGPDMLHKTRLNTNSQKVEATNRSIRRSLPRTVTFSRNFPGRVHSAVHSINNGPGESLSKLCTRVGCKIQPGSKVASVLLTEQNIYQKRQTAQKSGLKKLKRKLKRKKMYELYERHQEEIKYRKNQLMIQNRVRARRLTKLKKNINYDHSYCDKKGKQTVQSNKQAGECSLEQTLEDKQ